MLACPDSVAMALQHAVSLVRSRRSASVTGTHSNAHRETGSDELARLPMITSQVLVGRRRSAAAAQDWFDRRTVTPHMNGHDCSGGVSTPEPSERSDRRSTVISVWMTVAGQPDKASGHLQPSPSPATTIPMKATATAVMYDLREIIYERGGMQIDVFMFTLRGCVGPCRDPRMEECGGKDVESGAPRHVRGPYIPPEVIRVENTGRGRPREARFTINVFARKFETV